MTDIAIVCLLIINIVAFTICGIDKKAAISGKRRIPEKTLFAVSFLFGSIGMLLGMYTFRHKTKKNRFVYGIPVILVIQVALAVIYMFI